MAKKRKLPANFGPKDLTKLPPALRAYWEKKRAGEKGTATKSEPTTEKKATVKTAKKSAPSKKSAKKSSKTGLERKKPTAKKSNKNSPAKKYAGKDDKYEGVGSVAAARKVMKARGTAR